MKTYDYSKAKKIIEENKNNLKSAALGMHEDWLWTAETIFENGNYKKELPDNIKELQKQYINARKDGISMFLKEKDELGLAKINPEYEKYTVYQIGGLFGSDWATPTLQLCFHDGTEKMIPCHDNGKSSGSAPSGFLGVLSEPVQNNITPLSE